MKDVLKTFVKMINSNHTINSLSAVISVAHITDVRKIWDGMGYERVGLTLSITVLDEIAIVEVIRNVS